VLLCLEVRDRKIGGGGDYKRRDASPSLPKKGGNGSFSVQKKKRRSFLFELEWGDCSSSEKTARFTS